MDEIDLSDYCTKTEMNNLTLMELNELDNDSVHSVTIDTQINVVR